MLAGVLLAVGGLADSGRHTVRPGETLARIARDHGTTVSALVAANDLADPNFIVAGTTLVVPPGQTAAAAASTTHTVTSGETLASIARRYGTTVSALAQANGIANRNLIRIGSRLTIPGAAAAPSVTHTVAAGETLASIARRYGTTVSALAQTNGITNRNLIRIGSRLVVPGATAPAPGAIPAPPTGEHVVQPGETVASIARLYGLTVDQLAAANGITSPYTIYSGTRLFFGGGGTSTTPLIVCPVPGASFFNDWGFPRSGGRFHEGNDLFADRGTPISAPVAGTVTHASGALGGLQFRLVADDATIYHGSHLDSFGQSGRVDAGTVIGYVGDSGNAQGSRPHLHFEIRPGGAAAVNPYPTLVAACR